MPQFEISDQIHKKLIEFKKLIEVVIEEELDLQTCIEVVILNGMDSMLSDLISPLDHDTLVASMLHMATKEPSAVYQYIAETIEGGALAQQREEMRGRLGYRLE